MSENLSPISVVIAIAVICVVVGYFIGRRSVQIPNNEEAFLRGKEVGQQQAYSDFKLMVTPYVSSSEEIAEGIFSDEKSYKVMIGYKLQLMIKGMPCMEPMISKVEERSYSTRRFNLDKLMEAAQKAVELYLATNPISGLAVEAGKPIVEKLQSHA
jgi:hypothetical protein